MLIAVAYDIPDDRRRTKLATLLEDYGRRVQLSVFECLLDERQLARMRHRIERLIRPDEDSIRLYVLCGSCEPKIEILGLGTRSEKPDVYIV